MSRLMTENDLHAVLAAGYHCEVRAWSDCAYRPAPHIAIRGPHDGRVMCDACKEHLDRGDPEDE